MADSDADREAKPMGPLNKLETLVIVSIELEDLGGGGMPCMCLGGPWMRMGNVDGPGHRTDVSKGLLDGSGAQTDAPNASNRAGKDRLGHSDELVTYLGVEDVKHIINMTNGVGSPADVLTGHREAPSIETNAIIPENETKNVKTSRNQLKTQNTPIGPENRTPKCSTRWRKVNGGDVDVYAPWDVPIKVSKTTSRRIVFGRVKSGDTVFAPSVKGERVVEGDGNQSGGDGVDGDVDGATSGGDIDSKRVEAALLTGDSQHMRQIRRTRHRNSPVSSMPPIYPTERPNRLATWHH